MVFEIVIGVILALLVLGITVLLLIFWDYVLFFFNFINNYLKRPKSKNVPNLEINNNIATVLVKTENNMGKIDINADIIDGTFNIIAIEFYDDITLEDGKKYFKDEHNLGNCKKINIFSTIVNGNRTAVLGLNKMATYITIFEISKIPDIGEDPLYVIYNKGDTINLETMINDDKDLFQAFD